MLTCPNAAPVSNMMALSLERDLKRIDHHRNAEMPALVGTSGVCGHESTRVHDDEDLECTELLDGEHCGMDIMSELPSQQLVDNFVDDEPCGYVPSSRGLIDPMSDDEELEALGEQLLRGAQSGSAEASVGMEFGSAEEAQAMASAESLAREAICQLEEADHSIRAEVDRSCQTELNFPGEVIQYEPQVPARHANTLQAELEDSRIRAQCLRESPRQDLGCQQAEDDVRPFELDPEFDYDSIPLERK
eukprot:TRINITY_DN30508_c0_g1_i1.p1 TRINITY_DN30508_c0_g1~~TRINITY_DN30508_c0_g1_i1.p1  ORF type:complete len:247 (+),score=47.02 TRINITY_DN30508_c0_g1_i1:211-951(+)